ncbi:hypothetical protein CBL_05703 [Carabus blaptoides fortunei]
MQVVYTPSGYRAPLSLFTSQPRPYRLVPDGILSSTSNSDLLSVQRASSSYRWSAASEIVANALALSQTRSQFSALCCTLAAGGHLQAVWTLLFDPALYFVHTMLSVLLLYTYVLLFLWMLVLIVVGFLTLVCVSCREQQLATVLPVVATKSLSLSYANVRNAPPHPVCRPSVPLCLSMTPQVNLSPRSEPLPQIKLE